LLAFCGASFGVLVAWAISTGNTHMVMGALFDLHVTPAVVATVLAAVVMIAALGGLFPAIRAARLPIAMALKGR
jgi:putative ABC transport system permease protein